jgi:hypothetical protein
MARSASPARRSQTAVPLGDVAPRQRLRARAEQMETDPAGDGSRGRTAWLIEQRWNRLQRPHRTGRRHRLVIHPMRFVRPAQRQLQIEARHQHRRVLLKMPIHLRQIRHVRELHLVRNHTSRIRRRDAQHFQARIGIELEIRRRGLDGIALAHLVLRAVGVDAPRAQRA